MQLPRPGLAKLQLCSARKLGVQHLGVHQVWRLHLRAAARDVRGRNPG